MPRSRFFTTIAGGALAISLLGACSAESLAEFGLERALESSAEGDVDIDLSNGGFNLNSEEGNFSINFDEDNGGIFFDSDEGSGSILFDDEGNIVYDTDEGSGTVSISEEGIVVDGDGEGQDASFNFNADSSGATITTEDDVAQFGLTEAPATWPGFISPPASNIAGQTTYSVFSEGDSLMHTANFYHDAGEDYAQATIDRLLSAGFSSQFTTTTPDGVMAQLTNDNTAVMVIGDGGGITSVTVTPV
jgi:hypothetical protein